MFYAEVIILTMWNQQNCTNLIKSNLRRLFSFFLFIELDDEDGELDEQDLGALAGLTVANEADPLGLSRLT